MAASTLIEQVEDLREFFRQFALLFGETTDQGSSLQYLELLASTYSDPGRETNRRRTGPMATARSRRAVLESSSWHAAAVRGHLQTWIANQLSTRDGLLIISERLFPRRESQGDGIAPHYSASSGTVVSGQVGMFLTYASDHGHGIVDARLLIPGPAGSAAGDQHVLGSRARLALDMIDAAHESLKSGCILAGVTFGDDDGFREALSARGLPYLLEVSPTRPVFSSSSQGLVGSIRGRRRSTSRPRDLSLTTISGCFSDDAEATRAGAGPISVRESVEARVGAPVWVFRINSGAASPSRFMLTNDEQRASHPSASMMTERLDHPAPELIASPGESPLDAYDSVLADGWHRHMVLSMLAAAWWSDYAQRTSSAPAYTMRALSNGSVHHDVLQSSRPTTAPIELRAKSLPRLTAEPRTRPRGRLIGAGAALLAAVLLLVTVFTIAQNIPSLGQRDLIRLSSFYHPPEDGTPIRTLAAQARHVIYTRGDERYLQQLREIGFSGPALQYLVANEASGPEPATSATARCGDYLQTGNDVTGIARDFCAALHADERNFLHNGKGERLYSSLSFQEGSATRTRYYYLMNPGSVAWRDYFAARAQDNASALPYSGIFLDNVDLTPRRGTDNERNSDKTVKEYANEKTYREAVLGYLETVRTGVPASLLWANLTEGLNQPDEYVPYLPYLDGVMNEYFVTLERGRAVGPNGWAAQLSQADSVTERGKSFLAISQGARNDLNRMRFALASYLMIAGPQTYFRYADGEKYQEAWLFDDYENRLGSPLGRRYQKGELWYRDFTCGTVTVDIDRRAGDIALRAEAPACVVEKLLLKVPLLSR
ncbi:MAG: putative glycoside hydrolase [Chloroflexota bacterium]